MNNSNSLNSPITNAALKLSKLLYKFDWFNCVGVDSDNQSIYLYVNRGLSAEELAAALAAVNSNDYPVIMKQMGEIVAAPAS